MKKTRYGSKFESMIPASALARAFFSLHPHTTWYDKEIPIEVLQVEEMAGYLIVEFIEKRSK